MAQPDTVNEVLRASGLDPDTVRVLRHWQPEHPTPNRYLIWCSPDGLSRFNAYQSVQGQRRFEVGDYLASFADSRRQDTVFVGLYRVRDFDPVKTRIIDPVYGTPFNGYHYVIDKDPRMTEYEGRLLIWWEGRNYCQHAASNDKRIRAIRTDPVAP